MVGLFERFVGEATVDENILDCPDEVCDGEVSRFDFDF
jgi:hypothetical protein